MAFFAQIAKLLAFLYHWARSVPRARLQIRLILVTGLVSGLANAALIAVINEILSGGGRAVAWIFAGLCVVMPLTRFASGALIYRLSSQAVFEMRLQLSRRIVATSLLDVERLGAHRLLGTLTDDVPAITGALTGLPVFLIQIFIMAGCLGYMAWLSGTAFAIVVLAMALGIVTYQLPARRAIRYLARAREGWDRVMKNFRAIVEGVKELKIHRRRREDFFARDFQPAARELQRDSFRGQTIFLAALSWGHLLVFLVIGVLLLVLPRMHPLDSEVLSGYVLALLYMMTPLAGILDTLPALGRAAVAIDKIERLGLALAPEPAVAPSVGPRPATPDWRRLELAGVSHSYHLESEDRSFTLGPIDLVIHPGELIFIVGGNGSGKTTLAKLLIGLYEPETGEVRFAGETVTAANRERYREHFSVVFADFFLFDRLWGMSDARLDQRAETYLRRLLLRHKVRIEDGAWSTTELSQGQRKRLALLVAYLEDRPIYVFDEWAADQDPEFKTVFYAELLPELRGRGKTVIVITHDDRYFGVADRLIKLENGRVVDDSAPGGRIAQPESGDARRR